MKIGRNDQCPCGSGRKYKVCCLRRWYHFDPVMTCHVCGEPRPLAELQFFHGLEIRGALSRACVACVEEAARDEAAGRDP